MSLAELFHDKCTPSCGADSFLNVIMGAGGGDCLVLTYKASVTLPLPFAERNATRSS